jgi:hypothetical protein
MNHIPLFFSPCLLEVPARSFCFKILEALQHQRLQATLFFIYVFGLGKNREERKKKSYT